MHKSITNDARKTALFILNTLDKGRLTLDGIVEDVLGTDDLLTRRDRALANALVYGVLRWQGHLDWTIGHFSKTRLNKIDPPVLNILRLGLFQIKFLNRIPPSAAVNTSVQMAKSVAAPWVAKFVNGVLRNAAENYKDVVFPDLEKDPVLALAAIKSFPKWLIKRWINRLGLEQTEALCDAINTIPPITIRTNTFKVSRKNLMESLGNDVDKIAFTPYSPEGLSFYSPRLPIPETKAFQAGWFQVQDEAAQLVTLLLNPQSGQRVLDACAGLGGKTGHIAQIMKNQGKITAMDKDGKKLLQLASEMNRMGFSNVTALQHDLNQPLTRKRMGTFDRILLDAPCSGLGVLRRNPDTKWSTSKKDLSRLKAGQKKYLDALADLVKPSGTLVYAVCSTEPEENEDVISAFLNNHSEFVIEKNPNGLPFKARSLVNANGYFRTFPHLNPMDGFFAVCLKRVR